MRANGMETNHAEYSSVFQFLNEPVFVLVPHPIDDSGDIAWNVYWGDYDSTIFSDKYAGFPVDESLKELAWEHIHTCGNFLSNGEHCGCGKQPGKSMKIFGKKFDNLCTSILWFGNPDEDTIAKLYKLAEVWKSCIAESKRT